MKSNTTLSIHANGKKDFQKELKKEIRFSLNKKIKEKLIKKIKNSEHYNF